MSISLPNGTLLAAPSSSQPPISAAVTRILHLANFSPELKTRDIQNIFKEWETEKGGFRIKWRDDVNAMVVFVDANVAKRAYLNLILNPPPTMPPPATIRPYDGPDAAQIIQSLAARAMGHRASMSSAMPSGSISGMMRDDGRGPNNGGINSFKMPLNPAFSFGGSAPSGQGRNGHAQRMSYSHHRASSASSNWNRQSLSGALGFAGPSFGATRLPTHSEGSSGDVSRTASGNEESYRQRGHGHGHGGKGRRESVSAEKALREVELALQSVETKG